MEWRSNPETTRNLPTRRQFISGVAIGGSLLLGWALWPRQMQSGFASSSGETIFNGYLKIGTDGHIVVVVPQVEFGQACFTLLPQIVADELGADWRTVGVEPAPNNPLYATALFAEEAHWRTSWLASAPIALQVTDEDTGLRAYALPLRQAAALARQQLCQAAAARWGVAAQDCDTQAGFVIQRKQRLSFAALSRDAAKIKLTTEPKLRDSDSNRLIAQSLPRLDAPTKISGSANYAGDIRLPGMLYATIRQGPIGDTHVLHYDKLAARGVAGSVDVVTLPDGLVCIGKSSWIAAQMMAKAAPHFATRAQLPDDKHITQSLSTALRASGTNMLRVGDIELSLKNGNVTSTTYHVGLRPHATLEPVTATARLEHGLLEIWVAMQLPEAARAAAADVSGMDVDHIVIHSVLGGGSYGRRFELDIVRQIAALCVHLRQPVQLFWSHGEDMMHDRFAPAASGTLSAQVLPDGRINSWQMSLAAPATISALKLRTLGRETPIAAARAVASYADPANLEHARPPYDIPNLMLDLHPVDYAVPTGPMRGGMAIATCFMNENFVNQLAAKSGVEPLSFRLALLTNNPRLSQCLTKAAELGNWAGGGQGTNQGLACFATAESFVAVVTEAKRGEGGQIIVTKITAAVDIGVLINPDIARQQIEGGLLFGIAMALSAPITITAGIASPMHLGDLRLPRLAGTPAIIVELIPNNAPSADAWGIAVPPVAPALAAALSAGAGESITTLPFSASKTI